MLDFTSADLSFTNGTLSAPQSDDNTAWSAIFTPSVGVLDASNIVVVDLSGVVSGQGVAGIGTQASNNFAIDTLERSLSINDASQAEGNAGTTLLNFTVSLSAASTQPVTVAYASSDGTASAGSDYAAASGTLTFAAGETSKTVAVNINGDTAFEANETFNVTLSAPTAAVLGDALGVGTISNDDVPVITISPATTTLPTVLAGQAYSQQLTASGGTASYSFALTAGTLPAGLSLSSSGLLSGTPTATGNPVITVTATDASTGPGAPFSGSRVYTFSVSLPFLQLPAKTLLVGTQGAPYSDFVGPTTGGTAPYTYAVTSGALPAGITLSSTGALSGTPSVFGSFSFNIQSTDSTTNAAGTPLGYGTTVGFTLIINQGAVPTASVVVADSLLLAGETSLVTVTFSEAVSGFTNGDLTIANGNLSAVASGDGGVTWTGTLTPTANVVDASNVISLSLTGVVNALGNPGVGVVDSNNYAIDTVVPVLSIDDVSLSEGQSGTTNATFTLSLSQASSQSITVAYASANGTASAGADYVAGNGTATFAPGELSATVQVPVNGDNTPEADETFTITLSAPTVAVLGDALGQGTIVNDDVPVTVSPGTLASATVATAYNQAITASGGAAPYSFAITAGSLPAGVTLSSTGTLSGTPTAGGSFNFTVTATDSSSAPGPYAGTQAYTLSVVAPTLVLPPTTLPQAAMTQPYVAVLNPASGGTAPYSYAVTAGALPAGLTLGANGTFGGTPTSAGTFNFSVTATDSSTGSGPYTATQAYLIVSIDPPVANAVALSVAYNSGATPVPLNLSGGTALAVAIGAAPANGSALVNGTSITYQPTTGFVGSDSFTYTASNDGGTSAPATVTVTVLAPTIAITPATLANATAGTAFAQAFSASGARAPYAFTVSAGTLPAGMTLASNGQLSGTPGSTGSFNFTLTATDAYGQSGTRALTWTVVAPMLTLTPATVPGGMQHVPYAGVQFVASGGIAPYQYAITTGALPAGLSLSASGALTGTPSVGGSFPITVRATDSTGGVAASISAQYTLLIDALPDPGQDADVRGAIEAQIESTRRFADAQVGNFQRRLESLHENRGGGGFDNQISLSLGRGAVCVEEVAQAGGCERAMGGGSATLAHANADGGAGNKATLFNGWAAGSIRSGDQDGPNGGTEFETDGVSIGFDQHVSEDWAIGGGVGYGKDISRIGDAGTRNDGHAVSAALYSSYHPGRTWFIDSLLGYQTLNYELRRQVGVSGNLVSGERDGSQWFASVTAGGDYGTGAWLWTPYARWTVARANLEAYEESGDATFGLHYERMRIDSNTLGLGWRSSYAMATTWGSFAPRLRLEYLHDFQDGTTAGLRYAALPGSPDYVSSFDGFDRNRWVFGLGAALDFRAWKMNFEWQGSQDDDGDSQGIQINVEKAFK